MQHISKLILDLQAILDERKRASKKTDRIEVQLHILYQINRLITQNWKEE